MTAELVAAPPRAEVVDTHVRRNRTRRLLAWTLGAAVLVALFAPAYAQHISYAVQGTLINDDVRQQVFPFYKYSDPTLFSGDYIADYYRLNLPIGLHASYWLGAKLWDANPLSRALPYPLLLLTIGGLAVAARRLAGAPAAWAVALFTLSSGVFMDRIVGGLPRAFGFPLFAWGLAALVAGKPKHFGAVTVLGIAFYPIVGVVLGGTLGAWLLLLPKQARAEAADWTLKRRLTFLSAVAGACIFFTAIVLVIGKGYGGRVGPDDIADFPEAGAGGRYSAESRPPFPPVLEATWNQWRSTLTGAGEPVVPAIRPWKDPREAKESKSAVVLLALVTAFILCGYIRLAVNSREAQRLGTFVAVALGGYVAAVYMSPWLYLPERYTNYAVALLAVLLAATAPAGYIEIFRKTWRPHWPAVATTRNSALIASTVVLLAVLGGRGNGKEGYTVRVDPKSALYESIAGLPVNAVVAGWPQGPIELVPHVSRRSALFTYETHQAFHKGYMLEMRGRANAFFDAYLATDVKPLIELREKFGVTHLLVDFNHLNSNKFSYFRPFGTRIQQASKRLGSPEHSILHHLDQAVVFRHGKTAVFDLSRVNPG
jgi:hypothetical protein